MARTPKKQQQKPSDKPTQHEQTHLPNDRMDAATVRHYNDKIDREITAKNSASGSEGQLWEAFEKAGGNKQALKMVRKLLGQDRLKAQGFIIAFRQYAEDLGLFDQKDMFDKLFSGQQAAPAPTDPKSLQEINQAGVNAGMNGKDRGDNPWDDGTDAHAKWDAGWVNGQKQIAAGMSSSADLKRYQAEGKAAAAAGQPQTANPFEQGSDAAAAWNAGWWKGEAKETAEESSEPAAVH